MTDDVNLPTPASRYGATREGCASAYKSGRDGGAPSLVRAAESVPAGQGEGNCTPRIRAKGSLLPSQVWRPRIFCERDD